jgi:hypothetical protein
MNWRSLVESLSARILGAAAPLPGSSLAVLVRLRLFTIELAPGDPVLLL